MSKFTVFIQVHGRPGLIEAEVSEAATLHDIHDLLRASGVPTDAIYLFIDEAEEPHKADAHGRIAGLKHGCRIHATHCRRINVTVNFAGRSVEREFAPGVRVHVVKKWAVHEFGMAPQDAAEHVLQICGSTTRPTSDTPLNELVAGASCALSFDLVPETRVEG